MAFLVLSIQVQAAEMTYWYQQPTTPDNGEFVTQDGNLTEYSSSSSLTEYKIVFSKKTADFQSLGGWMSGIKSIEGKIKMTTPSSAKALVTYENGLTQMRSVNCLISKEETLTFSCFFEDHNNSFYFKASDKK